jgi:hypothetical protein
LSSSWEQPLVAATAADEEQQLMKQCTVLTGFDDLCEAANQPSQPGSFCNLAALSGILLCQAPGDPLLGIRKLLYL